MRTMRPVHPIDEASSHTEVHVATDDGSAGYHGLITELLRERLQQLSAGATVLLSILAMNDENHHMACCASFSSPQPSSVLSTTASALWLTTWLLVLWYKDCATAAYDQWTKAQAERALRAAITRQYAAVLRELTDTGLVSHCVRNPYTRILPWIHQQRQ